MDIRSFFGKSCTKSSENEAEQSAHTPTPSTSERSEAAAVNHLDIGLYVISECTDTEIKLKFLQNPWTSDSTYDFRHNSADDDCSQARSFRLEWLNLFPWLSYPHDAQGALCRLCILFRPKVQGAFIVWPFTTYKHFRESARVDESSQWHIEALQRRSCNARSGAHKNQNKCQAGKQQLTKKAAAK